MTDALTTRADLRRLTPVRTLLRTWRTLTGGTARRVPDEDRRTLVACSAGADSSALALALAAATGELVIGHVVHDLREPAHALADRDAARRLADRLGIPFVEDTVRVAASAGNDEANARRARYDALARMARAHTCPYVATAHHADDELETVLMGLLRGAGPAGLGGVRRSRELQGTTLIRPMLGLSRDDAREICLAAGWSWREDHTNADTARLRASIRHEIVPAIDALRPGAAARVARSASLLRDASDLIDDLAAGLVDRAEIGDRSVAWGREDLRSVRAILVGASLRRAVRHLHEGRGMDRVGRAGLSPVIDAVRAPDNRPRRFVLSGVVVEVDRARVIVRRSDTDER